MAKHHYEHGTALEHLPSSYRLESGIEVVERHHNGHPRFAPGTKVVVSWVGDTEYPEPEGGYRYVDQDAVEEIGRWALVSRYRARYERGRDWLSYRAEDLAVHRLNEAGVRAEKATAFEDEVLGVDFWVLARMHGVWSWLPIDITLRGGPLLKQKSTLAFWRRVVPIFIEAELVEENSTKIASVILNRLWYIYDRHFWTKGRPTLARHEAWRKEVRYAA